MWEERKRDGEDTTQDLLFVYLCTSKHVEASLRLMFAQMFARAMDE